MIHVLTSSIPYQTGAALALFESCREHCPDFAINWFVADFRAAHDFDALAAVERVIYLDDLPGFRNPAWLFQETCDRLLQEAAITAALEVLERPDCDFLLYFGPEQVIFSPLDEIIETLTTATVVLTPRLLEPQDNLEAIAAHEIASLRDGVYDPDFFGVRDCAEGGDFLRWWKDRCLEFRHRSDPTRPIRNRWLNLAPAFFESTSVLRNCRFNISRFNIHQRIVEGTFDEGFKVGNLPLGFLKFANFYPKECAGPFDCGIEDNQSILSLLQWHQQRSEFLASSNSTIWYLDIYENGQPILSEHRRIYRSRTDLREAFPNPYSCPEGKTSLFKWLIEAGPLEYPTLRPAAARAGASY